MDQLDIEHYFGGKVCIKQTRIAAGDTLGQHMHSYDHLSYLVAGRVLVLVDGQPQEFEAPACITIVAGKHHAVRAITPAIWLCIHGTECTDAEEIDKVLIHKDSTEAGALGAALRLAAHG